MPSEKKLFEDIFDVSVRAAAHYASRGQWQQATRWAQIAWKLRDQSLQH